MIERRTLGLLLLVGLCPATCFAYFDPNIGGVLFQWLAPLFAVVVVMWGRLKQMFVIVLQGVRNLLFRRRS